MNTAVLCVTELLKNSTGFITALFLLNRLFGYKPKIKKAALAAAAIIFAVASMLPFAVCGETSTAADIADIVTMAGFIVFPYLLFSPVKKLTFFWYGIIFNSTADFAVLILSVIFGQVSQAMTNLQFILIFTLCIIAAAILTSRRTVTYTGNFFDRIPTAVYIIILIADLATYYAVTLTRDSNYIESVANILLVASAVLVVGCIVYIVYKYFSVSEKQQNIQMLLDSQVMHNEEIIKSNNDIRRFRHDYVNNIFALSILIDQNKIEEAKEYLTKMNELPALTATKYSTGNYLADAIITSKAALAQENGVRITFDGSLPSEGISNNDLCTVLANALDNAVYNSSDKDVPVSIVSREQNNGVIITISNSVDKPVEIKNNRIKTSKKDKTNHGFGIDNIKNVAKEYNGFVNLTCDKKIFIIEIGLICNSEVENNAEIQ